MRAREFIVEYTQSLPTTREVIGTNAFYEAALPNSDGKKLKIRVYSVIDENFTDMISRDNPGWRLHENMYTIEWGINGWLESPETRYEPGYNRYGKTEEEIKDEIRSNTRILNLSLGTLITAIRDFIRSVHQPEFIVYFPSTSKLDSLYSSMLTRAFKTDRQIAEIGYRLVDRDTALKKFLEVNRIDRDLISGSQKMILLSEFNESFKYMIRGH